MQNQQSRRGLRDMTAGPPAGHLFAFALPLLAGSFLQQFYNMVDAWVVGRYVGDGALAAVGVGFPVIFLFSSLFLGLSSGGTVVIAQHYGAGDWERVRSAVATIYKSFLLSIVPVTAAAVALVRPMLYLLRVEPGAYEDSRTYLLLVCLGLVGSIGYSLNAGILGGLGNSRSTLLFLLTATGLNIALDFLFVAGFRWGVFGAALATILAQAASWLLGLVYLLRRYPELELHLFHLHLDGSLLRQILGIGLPAGLQMSLVALGSMVVMSRVNGFGKEFAAGYNVGLRMDQMAFLPIQSLAQAVTAFVGQNIGAGKPERARQGVRVVVTSACIWSLLMTTFLLLFSRPLIAQFSATPAVIDGGTVYLRGIMPCYILFAVLFSLNNSMRGAGDSLFPMVNAVLSLILLRIPAVYLLANRFGPEAMFWGYGIGWALGFCLSVHHYLTGKWLRKGSVAAKNSAPQV